MNPQVLTQYGPFKCYFTCLDYIIILYRMYFKECLNPQPPTHALSLIPWHFMLSLACIEVAFRFIDK